MEETSATLLRLSKQSQWHQFQRVGITTQGIIASLLKGIKHQMSPAFFSLFWDQWCNRTDNMIIVYTYNNKGNQLPPFPSLQTPKVTENYKIKVLTKKNTK
jgi:hypothetical protein